MRASRRRWRCFRSSARSGAGSGGVRIDVVPRQPEHLPAPQPQRDGEHERRAVRLALSGGQDPPRLVDRERLDVRRVVSRRVRERHGVSREAPSSDRVVEGLVQGAAHVVDRTGAQAASEQHGVQVLDVLGWSASSRCLPMVGLMCR